MIAIRTVLLLLLFVFLVLTSYDSRADELERANKHFDNENYVEARRMYHDMARKRHRFAQYRVGLIDYFGLAGEVDKVSAYAWFTVASSGLVPILMQIESLIDDELNHQERRKARDLAAEFQNQFGARLNHNRFVTQGSARGCTGSRLGKNCDRLDVIGKSATTSPHEYYEGNASHYMSQEEIAAFNRAYSDFIYDEFNRFDLAAGSQKASD